MGNAPERDWERLLAYLHGELEQAEAAEIEARLEGDPELCRTYLELAAEESVLRKRARSEATQRDLDEKVFGGGAAERPVGSRGSNAGWWVALAASIVAACAVIWGASQGREVPVGPEARVDRPDDPEIPLAPGVVGVLVSDANAVFTEGKGPDGYTFAKGVYELKSGAAHLRLVSGVDMVFRAPLRISIQDPMNVRIERGAVRVVVPEGARGFMVRAPQADVEDLGTEFGVSVDATGKASEVHVFEGRVRVRKSGGEEVQALLTEGRAVHMDVSGTPRATTFNEGGFPGIAAVELERWRLWSGTYKEDPTVLRYYDFEPDAGDPAGLRDRSRSGTRGAIHGARWTTGRWPGKQALLFDKNADFVELDMPGRYDQLTVAAWVKIDRFERGISVFLGSDAAPEDGAFLFFLSRSNRIVNGLVGGAGMGRPELVGPETPMVGTWIHVVAVFDMQTGSCKSFLNGRPSGIRVLRRGASITVGRAKIAQGYSPKPDGYGWQPFRGRMDELVIWNRALGSDEVAEIYRRTRPTGRGGR